MDMDFPTIPTSNNNQSWSMSMCKNSELSKSPSMSSRMRVDISNENEDSILNTNDNYYQEIKSCIDSMIENVERELHSNGVFNKDEINNEEVQQQESLMEEKIVDDSVIQLPPLFQLPETTSMAPHECKQGLVKLKDSIPILESILKAEAQVDTLICCSNGKLGAHRVILGLWSPLLRNMLSDQNYEDVAVLILPDISVRTMKQILYLAYNGNVKYTKEDEKEFLDALECLLFGADAELFLTTITYKSKPKPVPAEVLVEQPPSSIASTSSTLPVSKNISPASHTSSRDTRDTNSSETDFEMTNTNPNCPKSTKSRSHAAINYKENERIYNSKDNNFNYESDDNVSCSSRGSGKVSKSNRKSLRTSGHACKHCEKQFNDASLKVRHEKYCNSLKVNYEELQKLSYCNICDKQFKSIVKANSCLINHDCKRCYFCLQVCKRDDLLTHIQIHHSSISINEKTNKKEYKQVQCKWCKKLISVENNAYLRGYNLHCSTVHFSQLQGQEVKKGGSGNYVNSDNDVNDTDTDSNKDISVSKNKKRKYDNDEDYEDELYRKKKRKTTKELNSSPAPGSILNYITRNRKTNQPSSPSIASSQSPSIADTNNQNQNNVRLNMEGNQIKVSVKSGVSCLRIIEKMNDLVKNSTKEKPIFTIVNNKCTVNTHNIPRVSVCIPATKNDPIIQQYLNRIRSRELSKSNHSHHQQQDRDQNISIHENENLNSSLKIDPDYHPKGIDQEILNFQQETQLLQSPTTVITSPLNTDENETEESIENIMMYMDKKLELEESLSSLPY